MLKDKCINVSNILGTPHLRSVRFPERNGGLYPAAHFCVYKICVYTNNAVLTKYRTMIITGNYFPRRHIFPFHTLTNAALARRFCESSRHICRFYFEEPHQQLCINKISNLKTFTIYKSTNYCVFTKISPTHYPF